MRRRFIKICQILPLNDREKEKEKEELRLQEWSLFIRIGLLNARSLFIPSFFLLLSSRLLSVCGEDPSCSSSSPFLRSFRGTV